jgi:GH25 family lysozyme M1 (1,4-beta-N-acetylmuramidase)
MRPFSRVRAGVLAGVVFLGVLAVPALPAAAAPAASAGGSPETGHFNVAEPHSPRLMRELAGPRQPVSPRLLGLSAAPADPPMLAAVPGGPPGAVQGVDVASFQHPVSSAHPNGAPINWSQVAGAGIQFAAIKATEGNYYVNPFYASDLAGASAAGLSVLGYAFANPALDATDTAVDQAKYLVAHAGSVDGRMPPLMLDIEYDPYSSNECYGLAPAAMVTWLSVFVAEVRTLTSQLPILYTTQDWWAECTGASTAFSADPMWDAAYTTAPTPPLPLPAGWGDWALWQYTSAGTVPGITTSGGTDLDALNLIEPGDQQAAVGQAVSLPASQFAAGPGPGLDYRATGLPAGLAIGSTGLISGTPTESGAAQGTTLTAAAAGSVLGSVGLTWNVRGPLTVTAPASRETAAGSPVDFAVPAAAGPAGQSASFTATGLPSGTAISAAGQVTGWPARAGRYRVSLRATDSLGDAGTASFTWTVTTAPGTGPAGAVRLDVPGMCLADTGNKSAAGTPVEAATCTGGAAQRWVLAQNGTLRIHGKCLAVSGSAAVNGSKARLAVCSGAADQRWAGRGGADLVNASAGKCLAGPAARRSAVAVWISSCTGQHNQAWTLPAGPLLSQIPGGCLDDPGGRVANGTRAQIWRCSGSAAQDWTATPRGTLQFRGRCLQAARSAAGAASSYVIALAACDGSAAQRWTVVADGAGARLRSQASGWCLTDPAQPGATFASRPAVTLAACTAGSPAIAWQHR